MQPDSESRAAAASRAPDPGEQPSAAEAAFLTGAAHLGVPLDATQLDRFRVYFAELVRWNRRHNLTAITDYGEALSRHFLDSLTPAPLIRPSGGALIDVGTGAGFPGIPLAIARPDLAVTLLDSTQKRTEFCRHVTGLLRLDVLVVTARAEEAGQDPVHRERYDIAICRAVDSLPVVAEYLLPFCKTGGTAIAMKKGEVTDELGNAVRALQTMGADHTETVPVSPRLGLGNERVLVVMNKIAPTPAAFPRRAGIPRKRPVTETPSERKA